MSERRDERNTRRRRRPRAVVALGGNALLRRGEPFEAASQARAARAAARPHLAPVAPTHQLIVTHGNGPQVGLLSLMSEAYTDAKPYPLDVLGSETEGQIGYVLELELDNAMPEQSTVAVLTRVVVDPVDPAFSAPSKFIGPVYSESDARSLARLHGWTVKPDGRAWRRVVPSPEPQWIVQLDAIEHLVDAGFLVICTGGGIPVLEDDDGHQRGIAPRSGRSRAPRPPAWAAIGSLDRIDDLLGGRAGTQVRPNGPEVSYRETETRDDRAA
jgi:carbamate kinase